MSRSGARDTARRQLTETLNLFTAGLIILARSRTFAELAGTTEAASYLNDLDAFLALPAPDQVRQHPDNLAIDQFAATMKTKMAKSRAKGRTGWQEAHPDTLSNMLREHVEKADPVDVAIFSMMLHQLGHTISGVNEPQTEIAGPKGLKPALGETPETMGYQVIRVKPTGNARLDRPLLSQVADWGPAFSVIELVDRNYVAQLRAEIERLNAGIKRESDRNSLLLARVEELETGDSCWAAVIDYMLGAGRMEEPMEFLRLWNEGSFDSLRKEWPDAPEEIYLADPLPIAGAAR